VSNLHPSLLFPNNVDESGTMIANKQSCPHRNFRRKFPAFEIKRERTLSVRPGGGWIHYPRKENGKGYQCRFLPLISRIEEDFTDKMDLIYQISGSLNW
jgi:phage pi2 protein 07